MKILLVDGSEAIRQIQKTVLEALGPVEFVESTDGGEALRLIVEAQGGFDLVLIESNLPTLDGLTLVTRVRETFKTMPLVMATNEAEKSRVLEAIRAGVNAYIVKPFTPELLLEKIKAVLDRKKAA